MAKKDAILERSSEVFFKFGLSKISMDELADQIGISKKTIYNNFGSKENLMEEIIHSSLNNLLNDISRVFADEEMNVIDKIQIVLKLVFMHYEKIETPIRVDINAARLMLSPDFICLQNRVKETIGTFGKLCQDQGILKKEVNLDMLPYVFLSSLQGINTWIKPDDLSFNKMDLLKYTINLLLESILTPSAMDEYLKTN